MPAGRADALRAFQGLGGCDGGEVADVETEGDFALVEVTVGGDDVGVVGEFEGGLAVINLQRVEDTGGDGGQFAGRGQACGDEAEVLGHPPLAVIHLDDIVLVAGVGDVAFVEVLVVVRILGLAGDLAAVGPVLDFAGEDDLDVGGVDDDGEGILLAGEKFSLGELLLTGQAEIFDGGFDGDRLGRDDGVVVVTGLGGLDVDRGRAFRGRGGEVGGDGGLRVETLQRDGVDGGAGVVDHRDDDAAELVLEDHGDGVGARQDVGLDGGEEVAGGKGAGGGLVGRDGEAGRDLGGIRIVSGKSGLVTALGIPLQAAGESGTVKDELFVGGIDAGFAGDGQADGVTVLEVRLRGLRDDGFNADGHIGKIGLRGHRFFVFFVFAGGQQKRQTGEDGEDFFHMIENYCLRICKNTVFFLPMQSLLMGMAPGFPKSVIFA